MKDYNYAIRLSDIPKGSKIYGMFSDGSKYVIFNHLDGLYSFCTTENGSVTHIHRSSLLEKDGDGYILIG